MNQRDRRMVVFWGGVFFLMGLFIISFGAWIKWKSDRCTATTIGSFSSQYRHLTEKNMGVVTKESFDLTYSFEVDGKTFQNTVNRSSVPQSLAVTVRYEPGNPDNNELVVPRSWFGTGVGISFFGLILFVFGRRKGTVPKQGQATSEVE